MATLAQSLRRRRAALRGGRYDKLPRVPAVPDGWRTGAPDFVGIGAMRSGTSWWYRSIVQHPDVVAGAERGAKELHFFDHYALKAFDDAGVAAYHRYFPRPEGQICGEWTPRYLYDAWVPAYLHRAAPDARILAVLRDPVDRFVSGLTLDLNLGHQLGPSLVQEHLARGAYHAQLRRWLDAYPKEQLLVLQYERCRAEPKTELARTYAFLGLEDTGIVPEALGRKVNPTSTAKEQVDRDFLDTARATYDTDARALADEFDGIDLSLWSVGS